MLLQTSIQLGLCLIIQLKHNQHRLQMVLPSNVQHLLPETVILPSHQHQLMKVTQLVLSEPFKDWHEEQQICLRFYDEDSQ